MGDSVDELIQEIAKVNGVAYGRDDPLMAVHTMHSRLLKDAVKAQQALLDNYKEELESIAFRWGEDAKAKAERILNAALDASREAMSQTMQECAKSMTDMVKVEVDAALQRIASPVQDAKQLAMFNIVAACITCAASAVALWATFH